MSVYFGKKKVLKNKREKCVFTSENKKGKCLRIRQKNEC